MNDSHYQKRIEETLQKLEYAFDEVDDDLDYSFAGSVLTVTFSNGTTAGPLVVQQVLQQAGAVFDWGDDS